MLFSILIFFLILSLLILAHEFGHYFVAKKSGVKVEEFGFGLPPRIWGRKIGETVYSINALPFGGFVRLHGEQDENSSTNIKRSFLHKNKKVRALIIVAGVVMNFVLAIAAFAVVYSFSGIPRDTGKIKIVDVTAGSPAENAGILAGDFIIGVDGERVQTSDDFINKTASLRGKSLVYEIERNGENFKIRLIPRENPPEGEGPVGVIITTMEIYYLPLWQRPFYGIYYGFREGMFWGKTILVGLGQIVAGLFRGEVPQGISGPVGIYAITTEASKKGPLALINFVGILSVNLAILNIFPFPALDGGRLLFIGVEALTRKKVPRKVEIIINNVGFLLLLALILAITVGDIRRLVMTGGVSGFIDSMME